MLRTFVLVLALATALAGTTSLLGQERGAAPLTQILDDLKKAYDENDREKMGQLLKDMSESAQRFERGIGGRARGMGPGGGLPMRGGTAPSTLASPPVPKTEDEKKILGILDDMYNNQSRGMMNVPPADGRLLRLLTESAGAKHVVEIGTSNGYSGIWFCLALRTTGGKLTTHEIDARRASLARENFKRAGVAEIATLVEGDAHETVKNIKEPIDVLFIDADKEGYIDYLKKLLPQVGAGGLILAHNTNMGMQDYIKAITTSPDLETVFQNTQGAGIGVTLKKR